jgi:monomeric sarcosine oxidase
MRVAVVGIGGTGSAAARHLAQAGHLVTGYEQFRVGHDRGSSHGESRIIRYTYPDPLFTAMMADAYPLWADLEQRAGEELMVRCGGLFFGRHDDPNVMETEQALVGAGLPYERLDPRAAEARFPAFRFRTDEVALYQSESGLLRATRCVLANARLAREYGATLCEESAVTAILPHGATAIVRTSVGEEAEYDRVIVTAGAWMSRLFADLRLPLRVTRQQIVYFRIAHHPERFQPDRCPVWIDATALYYGFPQDGHMPGVKLASHVQGDHVDPDAVDRSVEADYIDQTAAYAARRLPDLSAETTHSQVCLYTNTPNEDFILDHLPDNPNIWLVSGCSGHGFKFTVLLGKIAADLATGGSYARDLSRFRLERFTG